MITIAPLFITTVTGLLDVVNDFLWTYTLLLPIGSVSFENGVASTQDYRFVYTIGTPSGIANIIGANGGKADVYTVNGVMVMKGADASALKTLKPGMYIINGKTYMLK